MQQLAEPETLNTDYETPVVCPVCWHHAVEKVDGISLSAKAIDGRDIGGVSVYLCSQWHMFAVFGRL